MTPERLEQILGGFDAARILVVGDLFLDKYLLIDPSRAETSLETGLEAHQVVEVRTSPGAAGTVVANLTALGVGFVGVASVLGDDGEGYDLRRGLERLRAVSFPVIAPGRLTPTYTKPMRLMPGGPAVEMNRLDHKNRAPLPKDAEARVIEVLRQHVGGVGAVIVADQVEEPDCGVVTGAVREELSRLARDHPRVVFFADSRARIGLFRGCIVKPNRREAVIAGDSDRGRARPPRPRRGGRAGARGANRASRVPDAGRGGDDAGRRGRADARAGHPRRRTGRPRRRRGQRDRGDRRRALLRREPRRGGTGGEPGRVAHGPAAGHDGHDDPPRGAATVDAVPALTPRRGAAIIRHAFRLASVFRHLPRDRDLDRHPDDRV